jgi:Na+/glutamate symporter
MYAPFRTHGSTSLLPQAITLLFLAFGLGALLVWNIRGAFRPVGVGLMLGWIFMTLISVGYFTGLNP